MTERIRFSFFVPLFLILCLVGFVSCSKNGSATVDNDYSVPGFEKASVIKEEYLEISPEGSLKVKIDCRNKLRGNVIIPEQLKGVKVVSIAADGFRQSEKIEGVLIPEGVTELGKSCFAECIKLKTVVLPNSLEIVGRYAFWLDESLLEVVIPDSVREIGDNAFANCSSLNSVVLSTAIREIPSECFLYAKSLRTIVIPEGVECIGRRAFMNSGLTEVTIPASVKIIDSEAFMRCSYLCKVVFEYGLEQIRLGAFSECFQLSDVEFPDSVAFIGERAFYMTGIERLRIPKGITRISRKTSREAFGNCLKLRVLELHEGMQEFTLEVMTYAPCKEVLYPGTISDFKDKNKYFPFWPYGVASDCVLKCSDGYITAKVSIVNSMFKTYEHTEIITYY